MARNQDDEIFLPDSTVPVTTPIYGVGTVTSVSSANGNLTVSSPTTTPNLTVVAAPKLNPGNTINGVLFDGSAAITIPVGTGTVTSVASADGSITVTNPTTTVDLKVVKATTGFTVSGGNSVLEGDNRTFTIGTTPNYFTIQRDPSSGILLFNNTTQPGNRGYQFHNAENFVVDDDDSIRLTIQTITNNKAAGVRFIARDTGDYSWYIDNRGGLDAPNNRLSFVSDATEVFTLSASGPIITGTWNATAIGAAYGGTGQTSYAVGDLLYASGATALSKLPDVAAGSYLRSGGVTTAPVWSTLVLPNSATSTYIPFATGTNTWGESSALTFNNTNTTLSVIGGADSQHVIVKAHSSQTANMQEWRDNSGTAIAFVTGGGSISTNKQVADETTCLINLKVTGTTRIQMNPLDSGYATRLVYNPISGQPAIFTSSGAFVFDAQSTYGGFSNTGTYMSFRAANNEYVRMDGTTQRVGIGHTPNATPNALLELLPSSAEIGLIIKGINNPQAKVQYDTSNYLSITVASTGSTTFALTGTTPTFTFSQGVTFSDDITIANAKNIIVNATTGSKIGTATSQKLGFWNAAPIVQPTTGVAAAAFVANTSGIVDDSATFGGYTIGQVVAALKNIGLLA